MKRSLTKIITSAALLLLTAAWIVVSRVDPARSDVNPLEVAQKDFLAPDFTLTSSSGETITLSDFKGQPVLVNLWASWCGPCRAEMPAMQRVYELYRQSGFVILAVNATNQDSVESADRFVSSHGLEFPILYDMNGTVAAKYRLQALPSSFFIAPDGRIREIVIGGPMAEALLRTRVEGLLKPGP